jgi:hypothetical protein
MALVQPAYHWTSLVYNTSLVMLAIATVGAFVARGKDRAYWSGFAFCGWAHFMFSLGPWVNSGVNSYIFSRSALDLMCVMLEHERTLYVIGNYSQHFTTQPNENFFTGNETARIYVYFLISGFSVFSVVSGVMGGWLANYLFVTLGNSEPEETAAE